MAEVNMEKWALITGASRGIGRAIAMELSRAHQLHIIVNYASNADAARSTADELAALGVRTYLAPFDVRDAQAVTAGIDGWRAANPGGRIEVLVNNAGVTRDNLILRMKDEEWEDVIRINLEAAFRLIRAAAKPMMKARFGRIISVTSVVGVTGNPGQANYAASKAGLIGMSKSLGQELASRGITVNCIAPGFIRSAMTDALNDAQKDAILTKIPAGALGEGDDIAAAAVYLASREAGYVTGQTLHVNGGMAMI